MRGQQTTIAYVADESRLHHLILSIASWRRFELCKVCVIDIGLGTRGRSAVEAVAGRDVGFLSPVATTPLPEHIMERRRTYAFEQKAILGCIIQGDPIIFLDSDILVVHPRFIRDLAQVTDNQLFAVPSAWDSDYSWTYTRASCRFLRHATSPVDFRLDNPICNSGVWAMRSKLASAVAQVWHAMFRKALDSQELLATLRPGTQIGDQEFLLPACICYGASWIRLHGSFNMQVHENRMPWSIHEPDGVHGGHRHEHPQPVRAIHYGCSPNGTVPLADEMISSVEIRAWIQEEYRTCWQIVQRRLQGRTRKSSSSGGRVSRRWVKPNT